MNHNFFFFLKFFLLSFPLWAGEKIQEEVDHKCHLIFSKLDPTAITPSHSDGDDKLETIKDYRHSLKLGIEEMKNLQACINSLPLTSPRLFSSSEKHQRVSSSLSIDIETAEAFLFFPEKFTIEALTTYYSAAHMGNADGIVAVAYYWETIQKDETKALKFYCWAVTKNSDYARKRLGKAFLKGELGLAKKETIALKYCPSLKRPSSRSTSSLPGNPVKKLFPCCRLM